MGDQCLASLQVEQPRLPDEWHDWRPADSRLDARAEISRLAAAGYGAAAIARSLNNRAIPTPSGHGRWHPETVKRHGDPVSRARYNAYMRGYRRDRLRG